MSRVRQPEVNIGTAGHIDHGKTTLLKALTGKWTDEHSEELKRGISIKLGYANCSVYKCLKCKGVEAYTTLPKCVKHNTDCVLQREISFVDAPGHETLMATMLSGAAIMDGCLFVIAANEKCPQPQTREHLMALQVIGVKKIIIVQNKIDLVDEKRAAESYREIKAFVKGTVADGAPIVPMSAQHNANLDVLLSYIEKHIPTPKRDLSKEPIMLVARSFDINRPGSLIDALKGGVLGGSIKQGELKEGDVVEIAPGIREGDTYTPIKTKIRSLSVADGRLESVKPGGSIGVGTELDPFVCKADKLAGSVVGLEGKVPKVWWKLVMDITLLDRIVGTKKEMSGSDLKTNEMVMINVWTAKTVGVCTSMHGKTMEVKLKLPVCIDAGEKVAISRKIENRWRLVGYGVIKG
jgi:translation initiation factor 2 subunit 3